MWEIDRVSFTVYYLPLPFRVGVRIQFHTSLNLEKKSNLVYSVFYFIYNSFKLSFKSMKKIL